MENLDQTIKACQQGNALAWEALIKAYQGKVFGVAFYMLKDKSEDAAQEVFIKLYRNLGQFHSSAQSFLPWLLTIARNCCLDRLRKSKTKMKYESDAEVEPETIADGIESPEEGTVEEQRKELLYQAIDKFDQTNKDILLLKDIQGLKTEDVAAVLEMPTGTIKSRSNRAKIKLAKALSNFSQFKIKASGN
ncbi:MAG: sigma-70 family RNA polymerase sigma factor [Pseudomonadales bacterium]|nr:sigma-70 family RNA polymerase sigma factor [Pseudomonadales bacterium]